MQDKLFLGKPVADKIKDNIKERIENLKKNKTEPTLAILRVGNKPDDIAYQKGATKTMEELGISVFSVELEEDATTDDVSKVIEELNADTKVHGVLMLRPLPKHIDENKIKNMLSVEKDIDCMSELGIAKILEPKTAIKRPCTPQAVIEILKHYNVKTEGKNAVVLGRSNVIGKPVALLLLEENATVTICHSKTENLAEVCRQADILISAIGKPKFVTKDFVKEGAVVIDVGINFDENNNMVGDADFENIKDIVSGITPVPGGVGSVTTTVLAMNLVNGIK